MLCEEQCAVLLERCEAIVGHELTGIRGDLRKASSRSAAIWELLCIEAASKLGHVDHAPKKTTCPDMHVMLSSGDKLWIEATFLYGRFEKEERLSRIVYDWLVKEGVRRDLPKNSVTCKFGREQNAKGKTFRRLPKEHKPSEFLRSESVKRFFDMAVADPSTPISVALLDYSIQLSYIGCARSSSGYSEALLESPLTVEEHGLFRKIKEKESKQYATVEPLVLCICSDQSPSLSRFTGPTQPSYKKAAAAALRHSPSIAAIVIVKTEDNFGVMPATKKMQGEVMPNSIALVPLQPAHINFLQQMDFNAWKYSFSLKRSENPNHPAYDPVSGGGQGTVPMDGPVKIEVPTSILVEALAGRTTLEKEWGKKFPMNRFVLEGWRIVSCQFKHGNIEQDEGDRLVLELAEPREKVFHPKKKP